MRDARGRGERAIGVTLRASDATVRWLLFGVFVNQFGAFVKVFLVDNGVSEGARGRRPRRVTGASWVLGALLGGRLADRIGRRATMTYRCSAPPH